MKGFELKIATEATFERLNAHAMGFRKVSFSWGGTTAGIRRCGDSVEVIFPGIDETKTVPAGLLHRLVGYACHELGHLWFTDNKAWDNAAASDKWIHSLINGLEDPRIEQQVIDSGFANNSRNLFTGLVNHVVDGEVPQDFQNIPFILAVEGRRLNGYPILAPQTYNQTPWAADIAWALTEAHQAKNTARICTIAIELAGRLQNRQNEEGKGKDQDEGQEGQGEGSEGQEGQEKQEGKEGKHGKQGNAKGKGKVSSEPADWIGDEVAEHAADQSLPSIEKPEFFKFDFV